MGRSTAVSSCPCGEQFWPVSRRRDQPAPRPRLCSSRVESGCAWVRVSGPAPGAPTCSPSRQLDGMLGRGPRVYEAPPTPTLPSQPRQRPPSADAMGEVTGRVRRRHRQHRGVWTGSTGHPGTPTTYRDVDRGRAVTRLRSSSREERASANTRRNHGRDGGVVGTPAAGGFAALSTSRAARRLPHSTGPIMSAMPPPGMQTTPERRCGPLAAQPTARALAEGRPALAFA